MDRLSHNAENNNSAFGLGTLLTDLARQRDGTPQHEADYSSVAYWYQSEPHAQFPPLPRDAEQLFADAPPPGTVEGESLVGTAQATDGRIAAQDMSPFAGQWSGAEQLWWCPTT
jgi:hypothetical protein